MKKLIVFSVLMFLSVFIFISWEALVFLNRAAGTSDQSVYFEVFPGDSIKRVGKRLEKQRLITDSFRFSVFARLTGETEIRVGEYELKSTMYPAEILQTIVSGRSVEHQITFQEGLNKFEMAELFASKGLGNKKEFLALVDSRPLVQELLGEKHSSLEGYLFPETYHVTQYTGAEGLIRKMVERFKSVYKEVERVKSINMSRHEIVTLASIIEKETGAPEERAVISSVYHNRLKKPMRLQADPTVLYGMWVEAKKFKNNITRSDLKRKTRYNTYTNSGLPYGPIANPGEESLKAAVNPERTEYLYFVSRNDGTHVFSTNYRAHTNAVRKFQKDKSARENKSWRDLSKRNQSN